jgi:hypothetical protein
MNTELLQLIVKKYPPLLNQQQYCELTGKGESTAEQDRIYPKFPRYCNEAGGVTPSAV